MAKSWVIVADSTHARIFNSDPKAAVFQELDGLVHEQSRVRESELNSDREGRAFDIRGGGRHGLSKRVSPHEHEAELFARLISERLNDGLKAGEFQKLQLAAPPAFLGILRQCLNANVQACLDKVVNKNIVNESPEEISDHFFGTHVSKRAGIAD